MKKNVFNRMILMLVMVAALCSMPCSAFAADVNGFVASVGIVSPRYATIRSLSAELKISSSGQASCKVEVSLYGSYRGEVTMYLQDRNSGWQTVKSWSGTGSGCNGSYYVPEGDSYRVKGVLSVYDNEGNLIETATKYSDEVFF